MTVILKQIGLHFHTQAGNLHYLSLFYQRIRSTDCVDRISFHQVYERRTSISKYIPPNNVIFLAKSRRSSPDNPDNKNTLDDDVDDLDLRTDILIHQILNTGPSELSVEKLLKLSFHLKFNRAGINRVDW